MTQTQSENLIKLIINYAAENNISQIELLKGLFQWAGENLKRTGGKNE